MLVTQALPGTICRLLGIVGGTIKLCKLSRISEQKYLFSQSSKQSKNSLWPRTECQPLVNTKQDKI